MPRLSWGLNDVKEYAPDGWYLMRVKNFKVKEGDKGQYVEWWLEFVDVEETYPDVRHITSSAAPSMVIRFLEACGVEWDPDDGSWSPEDAIGAEIECELNIDEYQGRKKNEINKVRPL